MAYVAPITWTTGQTVTAAEMNQNVRDNVAAVYGLVTGEIDADKLDGLHASAAGGADAHVVATDASGRIDLGAATGIKQFVAGVAITSGYQMGFGVNLGQTPSSLGLFMPGAGEAGAAGFEIVTPDQTTWPYTSYTTRLSVLNNGNVVIAGDCSAASFSGGPTTFANLAANLLPYLQAIKVNGLYFSTEAINPATSLGYGTWSAYAAGRIPIGVGTSDAAYAAGATGGATLHTNTTTEMANHSHTQYAHNHTQDAHNHTQDAHSHAMPESGSVAMGAANWGGRTGANFNTDPTTATNQAATATNQNAGSGQAYNNMPPYVAVYIWRRTA